MSCSQRAGLPKKASLGRQLKSHISNTLNFDQSKIIGFFSYFFSFSHILFQVQQGYPPNHVGPQRYGVGGRSFVNQVSNYTQGKIPADFADIAIQKSIEIKDWGLKTYRCTKQMYNEKVGKGTRTVDFHLDQKIEKIKDTKARYTRVLGENILVLA